MTIASIARLLEVLLLLCNALRRKLRGDVTRVAAASGVASNGELISSRQRFAFRCNLMTSEQLQL